MKIIYVIDKTAAGAPRLADIIEASQWSHNIHFSSSWAVPQVKLVLAKEAPATDQVIFVYDKSDVAGAGGYHDIDAHGVPFSRVFLDGGELSVTFSHELFEMSADPLCQMYAQDPLTGDLFPYEVCDMVESNAFDYVAHTSGRKVAISDFVLPAWFRPDCAGPYNFMGTLKKPFTLDREGYASVIRNAQFQTVWGSHANQSKVHGTMMVRERVWNRHLRGFP